MTTVLEFHFHIHCHNLESKTLRKKVSEKAKKATQSFDMTFFLEDKSENKEVSC
jgi:hypothetical protein